MEAKRVTIENRSKNLPITASLYKTDGPKEGTISHLIKPGDIFSIPKDFDGGCARLSINRIRPEDVDYRLKQIDIQMWPVWEGNIPVCNNTTLEVFPEEGQVKYKGRDLPKCTACENVGGDSKDILPSNYDTRDDKWYYKQMWYWYALLVVLAIILLYLLFAGRKR